MKYPELKNSICDKHS